MDKEKNHLQNGNVIDFLAEKNFREDIALMLQTLAKLDDEYDYIYVDADDELEDGYEWVDVDEDEIDEIIESLTPINDNTPSMGMFNLDDYDNPDGSKHTKR